MTRKGGVSELGQKCTCVKIGLIKLSRNHPCRKLNQGYVRQHAWLQSPSRLREGQHGNVEHHHCNAGLLQELGFICLSLCQDLQERDLLRITEYLNGGVGGSLYVGTTILFALLRCKYIAAWCPFMLIICITLPTARPHSLPFVGEPTLRRSDLHSV